MGTYDVLIGINLLREGLDIPEVSLVAILDADKEGFLRSERSLDSNNGTCSTKFKWTCHHVCGSNDGFDAKAIDETERRRNIQMEYNEKHGITPKTIREENTRCHSCIASCRRSKKLMWQK